MSLRHLNMSLRILLPDILTCFFWKQCRGVCIRSLNMPLRHLAWKNAKMSPRHLNMSPRHLARQKSQDILTCLSKTWAKNHAKMSPRHLNMSPRHLAGQKSEDILTCLSETLARNHAKMSPRHLNMSPRHLDMSLGHFAWKKTPKCVSDSATCLPDILTCLGDILFSNIFLCVPPLIFSGKKCFHHTFFATFDCSTTSDDTKNLHDVWATC